MFPRMSLGKGRTNLRLTTANVILVANAFVWYLLAFNTLKNLLGPEAPPSLTLFIIGVNTGAIALSGLLGSFLVDKLRKRESFLYLWIASGVILSLIPLGLNVTNINDLTLISLIFGLYFGLGMPATMGYHSAVTTIENRAKVGGFAFLIIGVIFAGVGIIQISNLVEICLILAFVRLLGLLIFRFVRGKEAPYQESNKIKYKSIISNRSFILYFVPWLMFTLINFMTIPIQRSIFSTPENNFYGFFIILENVVIALFAVFSGFIADKWGRKRLTIVGFITLGIGYAAIGLFAADTLNPVNPVNSANLFWVGLFYYIADGIAWGIFYVLFIFTLWGDLAQNRNSDKLYFLGALPYVSSYFIQLLFTPILSEIPATTIFPFASFFLFIAVLPLVYAPETLPEKLMKDRDLKSYVEKAKQKAHKEVAKAHKKQKPDASPAEEESEEKPHESGEGDEYDDAVKLAEKYY